MGVYRPVALWRATSLIADGTEIERAYLTEVFSKKGKPRPRTVLIAVGEPAVFYEEMADDDLDSVDPAHDPEPEELIVGLAVVSSVNGISMGKVRATLRPWTDIAPLSLDTALTRAQAAEESRTGKAKARAHPVREPGPLTVGPIEDAFGEALLDVLGAHDPSVREWLDAVRRERPDVRDDTQAQARVETLDAVGLAARLAGVDIEPRDVLDPPATTAETLLESVFKNATSGDLEEDLLPEDLRRFDGRVRPTMASASIAVFRSNRTQLVVYNVNKKPVEQVLGVDLVYWDLIHDVFTLVQYKRLERVATARSGHSDQWVYRREGELAKQLGLMPTTRVEAVTSADWRMAGTPFWFKFVRGDAAEHQDNKLLKGMYVPADLLRLAMKDDSLRTGPNGGFRVDYDNTRYVTRDVFVQLIQRGLVGTTSAQSDLLHQVVDDLTADGRSVVVAAKTAWTGVAPVLGAPGGPEGQDGDIGDVWDEPPGSSVAGPTVSISDLLGTGD